VVPTVAFNLLYALVIFGHHWRRLVHVAVTVHPTADWIARQISEAFPWDTAATYFFRDRDGAYGQVFRRRLRQGHPRSTYDSPVAVAKRTCGAIDRLRSRARSAGRRECLDHVIIFGEAHLRCVLRAYADCYNDTRTHLSLSKDAPLTRAMQREGQIQFVPHLGGLHHSLVRI